jgi:hypothetical protein
MAFYLYKLKESFMDKLTEAAKKKDLPVPKQAKILGISEQTAYKLLEGAKYQKLGIQKHITPKIAQKMSKFYDIPLSEIVEGDIFSIGYRHNPHSIKAKTAIKSEPPKGKPSSALEAFKIFHGQNPGDVNFNDFGEWHKKVA